MAKRDYYEVLGVDKQASEDEMENYGLSDDPLSIYWGNSQAK